MTNEQISIMAAIEALNAVIAGMDADRDYRSKMGEPQIFDLDPFKRQVEVLQDRFDQLNLGLQWDDPRAQCGLCRFWFKSPYGSFGDCRENSSMNSRQKLDWACGRFEERK